MDTERKSYLYFSIACLALVIGYLIYYIGRPGPAIYAIPENLEHWVFALPLLSEISGQLPSFFHTYAFILLTFIALGASSRSSPYLSISLWVSLESLFEIGQHPIISEWISNVIPAWFEQIPLLGITDNYFLQGTFDPLDMLAIVIAAVSTLLTVRFFQRREIHHD
jgi:hypothetical protein